MQVWWEIHDKHEEALLNHTTFETDDKMSEFVHIAEPPMVKKKNKKNKKLKS